MTGKVVARNKAGDKVYYENPEDPRQDGWLPADAVSGMRHILPVLPVRENNKCFYLIGSLRNPEIPQLANRLRKELDCEIFASWFAAGEIADDRWQEYESGRGLTYLEALHDYAACHVFDFDLFHLNRSAGCILSLPAGVSGHLEFGYVIGQGKPGFILLNEVPQRWDVMRRFAIHSGGGVYYSEYEMMKDIRKCL